jgi:NADPH:quinone reductase-like Zn-dependent oxidoreductase
MSDDDSRMRAIAYERYGAADVLHGAEFPEPAVGPHDLLVGVRAVAVTRLDCATREANRRSGPIAGSLGRAVFGVRGPRQPILGSEFAGEVVAVGTDVTSFAVGDRVFGSTGLRLAGYAERLAIRDDALVAAMPAGSTFTDMASITDGGLNAQWCLRRAGVTAEQRVLVYGASGAIGTAAVQLAKVLGADVTAVTSTRHLALARDLGADRVIDYTTGDVLSSGERWDLVFDAVGKLTFTRCRGSLTPHGTYLATDGFANLLWTVATGWAGGRRALFPIPPRYTQEDLGTLAGLIADGRYRPVVDRTYPFDEAVEAHRYVESERKTGNVVLTVGPDGAA